MFSVSSGFGSSHAITGQLFVRFVSSQSHLYQMYRKDMTEAEMDDLWATVRHVQVVLEKAYGATSCELGIQDGKHAGQTVPHVHVHILPRGTESRA